MPVIEGKKIILKKTQKNHLGSYRKWDKKESSIHTFPGGDLKERKFDKIIEERSNFFKNKCQSKNLYEVETKSKKHIGWVEITWNRKDEPHQKEFGIYIPECDFKKKSYFKDIIRTYVDFLFKEYSYSRLGYITWEKNTPFIEGGKELGFIEEGRIRRSVEFNGKFYDRIWMGILKEEWEKLQIKGFN